jgi:hypothetical protein
MAKEPISGASSHFNEIAARNTQKVPADPNGLGAIVFTRHISVKKEITSIT